MSRHPLQDTLSDISFKIVLSYLRKGDPTTLLYNQLMIVFGLQGAVVLLIHTRDDCGGKCGVED
jgi:hypothetical protein